MDRTLAKRLKRRKKQQKKHAEKERKAPAAPPNLDDVLDSEMTGNGKPQFEQRPRSHLGPNSNGIQVQKQTENLPVPPQSDPVSNPAAQAPFGGAPLVHAAAQAQGQNGDDAGSAPDDDDDAAPDDDDVVRSSDVLKASGSDRSEKRRSKGRGSGGDYGAAYQEFYTQLCIRMLNRIYAYFKRLYLNSKSNRKFRDKLVNIQRWNQAEINRRAREILEIYPDTEAFFRYAYAANVMLMSIIVQKDENSEDVEIEVPKFSVFIQKAYVESARVLFDNAGVLSPDIADTDRLKIRQELFASFGGAVATALRLMVPLDTLAPKMEGVAEKYDDVPDDGSEAVDSDESGEDESDEESESESESGSEDDDDDDGSEEDDESGSGSGSEEESDDSEDDDDESDDSEEEDDDDAPPRKRVGMSKRSMRTPDRLSIDDRFD